MIASKLDLFLVAYESGSAFVHLDSRREGVRAPASQRTNRQLVLQFGAGFPIPIRDLVADDQGIEATLTFDRRPFRVVVPWSAVYAIVGDDGRATIWESDLPADLVAEARAHTREVAPKPAPKLRLIKS